LSAIRVRRRVASCRRCSAHKRLRVLLADESTLRDRSNILRYGASCPRPICSEPEQVLAGHGCWAYRWERRSIEREVTEDAIACGPWPVTFLQSRRSVVVRQK